jgi:hypothetical protein
MLTTCPACDRDLVSKEIRDKDSRSALSAVGEDHVWFLDELRSDDTIEADRAWTEIFHCLAEDRIFVFMMCESDIFSSLRFAPQMSVLGFYFAAKQIDNRHIQILQSLDFKDQELVFRGNSNTAWDEAVDVAMEGLVIDPSIDDELVRLVVKQFAMSIFVAPTNPGLAAITVQAIFRNIGTPSFEVVRDHLGKMIAECTGLYESLEESGILDPANSFNQWVKESTAERDLRRAETPAQQKKHIEQKLEYLIDRGLVGTAAYLLQTQTCLLPEEVAQYQQRIGQLHLRTCDDYIERGTLDAALLALNQASKFVVLTDDIKQHLASAITQRGPSAIVTAFASAAGSNFCIANTGSSATNIELAFIRATELFDALTSSESFTGRPLIGGAAIHEVLEQIAFYHGEAVERSVESNATNEFAGRVIANLASISRRVLSLDIESEFEQIDRIVSNGFKAGRDAVESTRTELPAQSWTFEL